MAAKLDLKRELTAVDTKNYEFYNQLSDEEKKQFSPYVLMRFISNVDGSRDLQEWFIEMTNECVNKHHWQLSKNHKALLWKLLAATGVGSTFYHPYLAAGKKEKTDKFLKLLCDLNPSAKLSDLELLSTLMTKEERDSLFDGLGFDKKQRKEYE